jgi:hypothetical protein
MWVHISHEVIYIFRKKATKYVFAYGCNASEDNVDAGVFAKIGNPFTKSLFSTFMKNYDRQKAGSVVWEIVSEANRKIAKKRKCLKSALDYLIFI